MKTKIAIGCLVQWYEIEILSEYIDTLIKAITNYDKESVTIDITFTTNQDLEKISKDKKILDILHDFYTQTNKLKDFHTNVVIDDNLITIADYRRKFNTQYCEEVDLLVWGETDMLVPKQMFTILDSLNSNIDTPKYIATFGICKMWDDSWKPLEHIEFTDKPFIHGDGENWWQLRYTMNEVEMNSFNDKVEDLDISIISPHKYNGCGLVISSEVIKAGVNIPHSCFFIKEDTAFMIMTQRVLGNIPQYHFKNILLVHNRKHPNKRSYVEGENESYIDSNRESNQWYTVANKMCEENNRNLFNPKYKSYNWNDVWKSLN